MASARFFMEIALLLSIIKDSVESEKHGYKWYMASI